jgi:hypothetical protein
MEAWAWPVIEERMNQSDDTLSATILILSKVDSLVLANAFRFQDASYTACVRDLLNKQLQLLLSPATGIGPHATTEAMMLKLQQLFDTTHEFLDVSEISRTARAVWRHLNAARITLRKVLEQKRQQVVLSGMGNAQDQYEADRNTLPITLAYPPSA